MDDFTSTSLIPLQQDDPLLFQYETIPTIHPYLDHTINNQDLENQVAPSLASHQQNNEVTIVHNNITTAGKGQRKPSSAIRADNDNGKNPDDNKKKRAVHRDIERQRRQEMANLYASLRNLLPLEYIKGKRSISDHVHEAVKYIKHMENNIRDLEVKRDKLRNLLGGSRDKNVKNVEATNSSSVTLTVRPCSGGGIEILMKNDLADNWFPLSTILSGLLNEGLTIVSCVCTKINEKFLYTIQTDQATPMTDVDIFFLQERLTEKVMTRKNFESQNNTRIGTDFT